MIKTLTKEAVLPEPHSNQWKIINSSANRKVIKAGRRFGKTYVAAIIATLRFLDGKRVLYATPTDEQIARFWSVVKRALQEPLDADVYYKNETKHLIELPNTEQRIRAKTAWNADTLRGDYADLLILDEFQLMNEDTWQLVGAPMLMDNGGDAIFIFTPPSIHSRSVTKAGDPKHATKLFSKAMEDTSGRWQAFHFTSHENPYLDRQALNEVAQDMSSLAYRQEILAEDVDEVPGALWTRELLEKTRVQEAPGLARIVVAIDPQGKQRKSSETGIVAAGVDSAGEGYVFSDASVNGRPEEWGRKAIGLFEARRADRIIAESNFGGEMVEAVIRSINPNVPLKMVHASRGKIVRAEPISALFERGRCHIVGSLPNLEDELCTYTVSSDWSPNRLDAMVWALTELMLGRQTGYYFGKGDTRDIN